MITERISRWLSEHAYPLWLERGPDRERGGFIEALSLAGAPLHGLPRRSMVQARQMYSFRLGAERGLCDRARAEDAIESGLRSLLRDFSDPSGGFIHSVDADLKPLDRRMDLYAQAFTLFGLAQAHRLRPREDVRKRARALVEYLRRERAVRGGGFTELGTQGEILYQSNPHMHLYEAALAWLDQDDAPEWARLADELLDLALSKFIDAETGLLGEHFDENWSPARENGRFLFEPGHQYEWSWLMGVHETLSGRDLSAMRRRLYDPSEARGISPDRRAVYDQLWSDFDVRLKSSRFWPQGERIKAAASLGDLRAADEACETLFRFLDTSVPGLWYDTWEADGGFKDQPVKASSLYHIAGAFCERLGPVDDRGRTRSTSGKA